eukprot:TRINITY_DN4366_c0_g1_i1.p1 TRINITY_DN4366_c0_g1~~TRINITY_DN4366_c0_g1_i1.p1  ORF type:complete len:788 (+),score=152.12 TRINITY_DN4366_c0_g1_i1:72-2435(+)
MEIRRELFDWLVRAKAVDGSDAQHIHNRVKNRVSLSKNTLRRIESAEMIATLLCSLADVALSDPIADGTMRSFRALEWSRVYLNSVDLLREVKPTVSKSRKVANWDTVIPILGSTVMEISDDQRDAITEGNFETVLELMGRLYEVFYTTPTKANSTATINTKPKKAPPRTLPPVKSARDEYEPPHGHIPPQQSTTPHSMSKDRIHGNVSVAPLQKKIASRTSPAKVNQIAPLPQPQRNYANCFDMLAVNLSESLECARETAEILLSDPDKRRLLIVEGVHGEFRHVRRWFKQLLNESNTLSTIMVDQAPDYFTEVLDCIVLGIQSADQEVVNLAIRNATTLSNEMHIRRAGEYIWEWFTAMDRPGDERGIHSVLHMYNTTSSSLLKKMTFPLLIQIGQLHFLALFEVILPSHFPDTQSHVQFLHDFITFVGPKEQAKDLIIRSGVASYIIRTCLSHSSPSESQEIRCESISTLTDIWLYYPEEVHNQRDLLQSIVKALKKAARNDERSMRILAQCCLLNLLDYYVSHPVIVDAPSNGYDPAQSANPDLASLLFGHVVFHLMENYEDLEMRTLIVNNIYKILLKPCKSSTLAPGPVISPYIKQMLIHGHDVTDMGLLFALSKHPNLDVRSGVFLLQLVTKICAEDEVYHQSASLSLVVLINRFHNQKIFMDSIETLIAKCVDQLVTSEDRPSSPFLDFADPEHNEALIRITLVLSWLVKIVSVKIMAVNQYVLERVRIAVSAPLNPQAFAGIRSLLSFFEQNHDVKDLLNRMTAQRSRPESIQAQPPQ